MKKYFVIGSVMFAAVFAASCSKELTATDNQVVEPGKVFRAELNDTKTVLTPADKVEWAATDEVAINGIIYTVTPDSQDATKATLTKKNAGDTDPSAPYTAMYPASLVSGTKYTLPGVQVYSSLNDLASVSPMSAYGESQTLSFKNICALLEMQLTGETSLKRVYVKDSKKGLSGEFTVTDDAAAVTGTTGVTLDCKAVGELSETAKKFYLSVPAGTYSSLKFYFSDIDDNIVVKSVTSEKTLARNTIYPIPVALDFSTCEHRGVQLWDNGVFWSKCNLGASEEYEYGDYYAWAETNVRYTDKTVTGPEEGKYSITFEGLTNDDGEHASYTTQHGSYQDAGTYTKYLKAAVKLDSGDDAAIQNWGDGWKMPTTDNMGNKKGLTKNCYLQSKLESPYYNGVAGYLAFRRHSDDTETTWNKQNSKTPYSVETDDYIFLPATGYVKVRALTDAGTRIHYWTNTCCAAVNGNYSRAYSLAMYQDTATNWYMYDYRYFGITIRPVME